MCDDARVSQNYKNKARGQQRNLTARTVTHGVRSRLCQDVKGQSHQQADHHVFDRAREEDIVSPINAEGVFGLECVNTDSRKAGGGVSRDR